MIHASKGLYARVAKTMDPLHVIFKDWSLGLYSGEQPDSADMMPSGTLLAFANNDTPEKKTSRLWGILAALSRKKTQGKSEALFCKPDPSKHIYELRHSISLQHKKSGTAGWFRVNNGDGCRIDGDIGVYCCDLHFSSTSIFDSGGIVIDHMRFDAVGFYEMASIFKNSMVE